MRKNRRFITSPRGGVSHKDSKVTVILLSEKVGHRMKSYGPTALLSLGNRALLEMQVAAIQSVFKNVEIVVCCDFFSA